MKTTKKGLTLLVLLPLMLLSLGAAAQSDTEETYLGFTKENLQMMGMIALGVGAIVVFAWITTREKKKDPTQQPPVVKRHSHHHHHRVHKLRR